MTNVELKTSEGIVVMQVTGYHSPGRPVGLKITAGNLMLQMMPELLLDSTSAKRLIAALTEESNVK